MRVQHKDDCALMTRRENCSCGASWERTRWIIEETRKLDERRAADARH